MSLVAILLYAFCGAVSAALTRLSSKAPMCVGVLLLAFALWPLVLAMTAISGLIWLLTIRL